MQKNLMGQGAAGILRRFERPSFSNVFNAHALGHAFPRLLAGFAVAASALVLSAPSHSDSLLVQDNTQDYQPTRTHPLQGLARGDDGANADAASTTSAEYKKYTAALNRLAALEHPNKTDIIEIQNALNIMNYTAGREDGIFGANTAGAFGRFLRDHRHTPPALSSWMVEHLAYNGQRDILFAIIAHDTASSTGPHPYLSIPASGLPATASSASLLNVLAVPMDAATWVDSSTRAASPASVLSPLPDTQIIKIQAILKASGYLSARADGDFGFRTAGALMGYLGDHKDDVALLSPWLLQQLMNYGHQNQLTNMIQNNPGLWLKISDRLYRETQVMTKSDPQSVLAVQSLMRAAGIYTGRIDGAVGDSTQSALADLDYYFKTADASTLHKITGPAQHQQYAQHTGNNAPADNILGNHNRNNTRRHHTARAFADAGNLVGRDDGLRAAIARGNLSDINAYLDLSDTPSTHSALHLDHPVHGHRVSSHYGPRYISAIDRRMRMHQGIDFSASTGVPIESADKGRIVLAGWHGDYGRSVLIDHGNGIMTHYAHMSRIAVKRGDYVAPGQKLGAVGASGRVLGSHLHFEIILRDRSGTPVVINAEKFMGRDLSNPQIRLAAIADARLTARTQGWRESKVVSRLVQKRVPTGDRAGERAQATLTRENARTLLGLLATDHTLLAITPKHLLTSLRHMGYGNEVKQLTSTAPSGQIMALAR